jgi:hypothetical protein
LDVAWESKDQIIGAIYRRTKHLLCRQSESAKRE